MSRDVYPLAANAPSSLLHVSNLSCPKNVMTRQRLGSTGLNYNKGYLSFTWHKVQKYAFQGQCSCPVTWIQALPIFLLCHHLLLVFASPLCCPVVIRWLRQPQTSCLHSMGLCKKETKSKENKGGCFSSQHLLFYPCGGDLGGAFPVVPLADHMTTSCCQRDWEEAYLPWHYWFPPTTWTQNWEFC